MFKRFKKGFTVAAVALLAMAMLLPAGSTFAAEVITTKTPNDFNAGLLDESSIGSNASYVKAADNDLTTDVWTAERTMTFTFNSPVDINGLYINNSNTSYFRYEILINDSNIPVVTLNASGFVDGEYYPISINNVRKIVLKIVKTTSSPYYFGVNEVEFFGSYEVTDTDGDGIPDSDDPYPDDPTNTPPPDTDGDGIPDSDDPYPDDPTNTPPPLGEVKNLEIEASYDEVNLSWTVPKDERFHHVNIYRDEIQQTSLLNEFLNGATVYAASEEIFETNGTYFIDKTVEPEKEYEYTVTTTDTDGIESAGVTVKTATPVAPPIDIKNVTSLPFNAVELLKSGTGLLFVIGPFVLLALAFLIVPKLIKTIRASVASKRTEKEVKAAERRFKSDEQAKESRIEKAGKPAVETVIKTPKEKPAEKLIKEPRIRGRSRAERAIRTPKERRERAVKEPRAPRISNRRERTPRQGRRAN